MKQVREHIELGDWPGRGEGVRIAVLGSGVDFDHPDLRGRVNRELSTSCCSSPDLTDHHGLGTHMVGIIAGTGAASEGVYQGLAPESELIVVKISSTDRGPEGNAIKGVELALDAGAEIICYGFGHSPRAHIGEPPWVWPESTCLLEEAFAHAVERGVLCIVAAGDEGPAGGTITRPGGLPSVLTVGAAFGVFGAWHDSGRGPYYRSKGLRPGGVVRQEHNPDLPLLRTNKPDVVMPSVPITAPRSSFLPADEFEDPRYLKMAGTAQAAAVAAGVAACLLGVAKREGIDLGPDPGKTAHALICHSGRELEQGGATDFGRGIVLWPVLESALRDYGRDPEFKDQLLRSPGLQLL